MEVEAEEATAEEAVTREAAAVSQEAEPRRPEPQEAVLQEAGQTGDPDTRTYLHLKPAGPIGPMGRGRGFVRTDITALGETTKAPDRDTIETSWPELKWK